MTVARTIHVAGELQSVGRLALDRIPSLFVRNERVVCHGAWRHGFMSATSVGAYNVGSIKLTFGRRNNDEDDDVDDANAVAEFREGKFQEVASNTSQFTPNQPPITAVFGRQMAQISAAQTIITEEDKERARNVVHRSPDVIATSKRRRAEAISLSDMQCTAQYDTSIDETCNSGVARLDKGQEMARFELCSTVVLIFEVPEKHTFSFDVRDGDKVRVGASLGCVTEL
jgi:phosphatidylserine decarboxylase